MPVGGDLVRPLRIGAKTVSDVAGIEYLGLMSLRLIAADENRRNNSQLDVTKVRDAGSFFLSNPSGSASDETCLIFSAFKFEPTHAIDGEPPLR